MNTCNFPACRHDMVAPLPKEKWIVGQAVKFWYHSPDYRHENGKLVEVWREPSLRYGAVSSYDSPAVEVGRDGIFVAFTDNKPNNGSFWAWDFMIESGIGYMSPIVEA